MESRIFYPFFHRREDLSISLLWYLVISIHSSTERLEEVKHSTLIFQNLESVNSQYSPFHRCVLAHPAMTLPDDSSVEPPMFHFLSPEITRKVTLSAYKFKIFEEWGRLKTKACASVWWRERDLNLKNMEDVQSISTGCLKFSLHVHFTWPP